MSVKRKEKSVVKTVCFDVGLTIAIFILQLLVVVWMINRSMVKQQYGYIVVAFCVLIACVISASLLKKQQSTFALNAVGTGMLIVLALLLFLAQQGSGAQASALLRCTVLILIGRFIPSVIKMRKKHKTKRRSVR